MNGTRGMPEMDSSSRKMLAANLIGLRGLSLELNCPLSSVQTWPYRYADFPAPLVDSPVVPGAVYWRPDLERFLRTHGLPARDWPGFIREKAHNGGRRLSLNGQQIEAALKMRNSRDDTGRRAYTDAEIAESFKITPNTLRRYARNAEKESLKR